MVLTATAKYGSAGLLIIGAILGPSLASSTNSVKVERPANVQGLLDWEKLNGDCKIFMAVSRNEGKLYRPGDAENDAITDAYKDKLLKSLSSGDSVVTNKNACANKKGKALVFARSGEDWIVDVKDWKDQGGDVETYKSLFIS